MMTPAISAAAHILSFDSFAEMEAHLQEALARHRDAVARYRETLGGIMRAAQAGSDKGRDEKWLQEMKGALDASDGKSNKNKKRRQNDAVEKSRGFFSKEKKRQHNQEDVESWVAFDPFSVFVGDDPAGAAEVYFEAINHLEDTANKIQTALHVMTTIRSRAASPGGVSLVASFVGGAPSKIIIKPASASGKKSVKIDLAIPSAPSS
jgi:hypothetical protein